MTQQQKKAQGGTQQEAQVKSKALDLALSQIEKQFGKGSIMKLGSDAYKDIQVISTGASAMTSLARSRSVIINSPRPPPSKLTTVMTSGTSGVPAR